MQLQPKPEKKDRKILVTITAFLLALALVNAVLAAFDILPVLSIALRGGDCIVYLGWGACGIRSYPLTSDPSEVGSSTESTIVWWEQAVSAAAFAAAVFLPKIRRAKRPDKGKGLP